MNDRSFPGTRVPLSWREPNWAAIPLRLVVGFGLLAHGYAKLRHGPDQFSALVGAAGIPAPEVIGWATILFEAIGGLCVLAGAFVSWMSLPLTAILLVAAVTVHLPYGFSSVKLQAITPTGAKFGPPGYEVDLLYVAGLAALVIAGSGPLSVDGYLQSSRNKKVGGAR